MRLSNSTDVEDMRQQFLVACELSGDSPPNIDAFLTPFPESERSVLRSELESVLRDHLRRVRPSVPSDAAVRGTRSDVTAETKQNAPPGPSETQELLPEPAAPVNYETIDQPKEAASPDGTIDQPTEVESPDGTMDHVAAPVRSVGGATTPEGTMDHDPSEGTTDHVTEQDEPAPIVVKKKPASTIESQYVAGYEILDVLGRGAMGVVYKARQRGLKRLVALKMILSGSHASANDLARFHIEANAVAQLQHPGIVQLYEVGEDEGRPFFSLEFVDGPSLHKKLQGEPMPPKEAARLLQQMAEAMAYAHERGVIHRDLKPANVMMTSDGIPKIGDFGLAKTIDEEESGITRAGTILGTPSYMSPEQGSGLTDEIGPLADVYSLGAILYDMLVGRPPFRGTSVMDTLQQLRTREPVPLAQLQPGVPRDLETICLKCLEKDRTKRYADAGALAADLGRFLNGEPILARPISKVERAWRWCRRNPGKAMTAAAAILGIAIYAVSVSVLSVQLNTEKKEAIEARNNEADAKIKETDARILADQKTVIAQEKTVIAEEKVERQRLTARESIDGMIATVQKFHETMQSKRLSIDASPEILKLRASMMADMRKTLTTITQKINAVAKDTYADLYAAQLVGQMLMKFGQSQEPRQIFETALKSAQNRVNAEPANDRARGNLGIIEQLLGDVALDMEEDSIRARTHYVACRKLHEEIFKNPRSTDFTPLEIKRQLAHDDIHLGRSLVGLGQSAEAIKQFQEALAYYTEWLEATPKEKQAEPRSYVMQARMWLGIASGRLADAKGVEEHFGEALNIGNALVKLFAEYLPYKVDLADVLGAYGDAQVRLGKIEDAKKNFASSLEILKFVTAKLPDDSSNQSLLALTNERLGLVSTLFKQPDDAKKYYKEAAQLRKELWQVETGNLARQIGFVLALARAGVRDEAITRCNIIRSRMTKSPELMLQVARCDATFASEGPDRKKHIDNAMSSLTAAIASDYRDVAVILADNDLAVLREEPAFKDLVAKLMKK